MKIEPGMLVLNDLDGRIYEVERVSVTTTYIDHPHIWLKEYPCGWVYAWEVSKPKELTDEEFDALVNAHGTQKLTVEGD